MLQKILQDSWTLADDDKDMIVMQHLFGYEINGEKNGPKTPYLIRAL